MITADYNAGVSRRPVESRWAPMDESPSIYDTQLTIVFMVDQGAADPVRCSQM